MEITSEQLQILRKMKIGVLVRTTLPEIITKGLISKLEIKSLQKADYSKLTFDINYPILKKIDEKRSIKENRFENSYSRYYADPIETEEAKFLITSEWYEKNLEDYLSWLKRKVND